MIARRKSDGKQIEVIKVGWRGFIAVALYPFTLRDVGVRT